MQSPERDHCELEAVTIKTYLFLFSKGVKQQIRANYLFPREL